jgi:hypothetical protein
MPFSHGLIGALAISVLFAGAVTLFYGTGRLRIFFVLAAAVFSHWLLDLVVHVPDLPLWGNTMKVGFGLWRWVWISIPLEIVTLVVGAIIYTRMVPAKRGGNVWLWAFVALMSAAEAYNLVAPPPTDTHAMAIMALVAYGVLAMLAGLVDLTRDRHETAALSSP